MEKSKIYLAIVIVGGVLFLYGSITFMGNSGKKFDPSKSKMTIFGRDDLSNQSNLFAENSKRKSKREGAIPWIIIGGVIIFVGLILKPRKGIEESEAITEVTKIQIDGFQISKQTNNPRDIIICDKCGSKLEYIPAANIDNDLICHICNAKITAPKEFIENEEQDSLLFINCKECDVSIELDESDLKNGYFICPGCNVKNILVRIVTFK